MTQSSWHIKLTITLFRKNLLIFKMRVMMAPLDKERVKWDNTCIVFRTVPGPEHTFHPCYLLSTPPDWWHLSGVLSITRQWASWGGESDQVSLGSSTSVHCSNEQIIVLSKGAFHYKGHCQLSQKVKHKIIRWLYNYLSFRGGSDSKASVCNAGDPASIPGSGRSPGEGNSSPLQ